MSTKLSTDLNITRPSTKLHNPPGGRTTISFGDPDSTTPPAAFKTPEVVVVAHVEVKEVAPAPVAMTSAPSAEQTIAIVVAGSAGTDAIISAAVKALASHGITSSKIVISRAEDAIILPYIVQRVVKQHVFKVVLAIALVANNQDSIQETLTSTLLQLGVQAGVAIVPAVLSCESLLEMKALLPALSTSWANSAANILEPLAFYAAVEPAAEPAARVFTNETLDVETLLENFRESLKAHGARGIFGLGRKFKIVDDNNNGLISLIEFRKLVAEHSLAWTAVQEKAVFDSFDKDKSGGVNFDEFLNGVRGALNDRRRQLVLTAYEILDADKSGVVDISDIKKKYDGSKHPDVIAGKRTEHEVLTEFMETFDINKDGKVTVPEFCEYYSTVSASIDDDDYFELMMRNAWHISGGEGWCANSSCRRVLVTHSDGHQSVEEIKNDIGMKGDDKAAMMLNLTSQGIKDIVSIDTKGATEEPATAATATTTGAGEAHKASAAGRSTMEQRPSTAPPSANHRRVPGGGCSSIVLG